MPSPATIKIFLPQGDPKKIRVAELSNWSGKALSSPRSTIDQLLSRPETSKAGIYILLGSDPKSGEPTAYIGEAEVLCERIKKHKSRDDWNHIIIFISKDDNLTKSHIRYLEGSLIQVASEVGRYVLINKVSSGAHLPEADRHEMDVFLFNLMQLLPVLGTELTTPLVPKDVLEKSEDKLMFFKTKDASAAGFRTPNGFVVIKGSSAVLKERASAKKNGPWTVSLREKLKKDGAIVEAQEVYLFTKDVEFSSPSAAAGVIQGGTAQGTVLWKSKDGKTLKVLDKSI